MTGPVLQKISQAGLCEKIKFMDVVISAHLGRRDLKLLLNTISQPRDQLRRRYAFPLLIILDLPKGVIRYDNYGQKN